MTVGGAPSPTPLWRRGDRLPDVALVGPDGGVVGTAAHRQHRSLILLFLAEANDCAALALLQDLAPHAAAVAAVPAHVLPILLGDAGEAAALRTRLGIPFEILPDPDGRAHRQARAVTAEGRGVPTAYVVDRYGEVFFAQRLGAAGAPLRSGELVGWLDYLELLCPE